MTADLTPLDVLRRDGWCKGRLGLNVGEPHCTVGAVVAAGWAGDLCDEVVEVINEQFPSRARPSCDGESTSIALFNDHPDTTFADVELVLEKAQIRYDERVQS